MLTSTIFPKSGAGITSTVIDDNGLGHNKPDVSAA